MNEPNPVAPLPAVEQQPYGLWHSPIQPRTMSSSVRLGDVQWDTHGSTLVWLESRAGRSVLVVADLQCADAPRDLTTDAAIRGRVGYGGGDFAVGNGQVVFAEKSGRLYRLSLHEGQPQPITPAFGSVAAPVIAPDARCVVYVQSYEDTDVLAVVDVQGQHWPQILFRGHDFFMQPCWHPNGKQLAFIAWDHPQMPWDGSWLYLATLQRNEHPARGLPAITRTMRLAGGTKTSILQPAFSPDGRWLAYVSDERGWGQIYLYNLRDGKHQQLTHAQAEHGTPAWVQGLRTYAWSHDSQSLYVVRNEQGFARLFRQPINGDPAQPITALSEYSWLEQPACHPAADIMSRALRGCFVSRSMATQLSRSQLSASIAGSNSLPAIPPPICWH